MFNFFNKNKKIHANKIKEFEGAIKAINVYIALSDWSKADSAIKEILLKEKESLDELLKIIDKEEESIFTQKQKDEEKVKYKQKERKIFGLRNKLEKKERAYIKEKEKERFKIRFQKIRNEMSNLIGEKKPLQAMDLLQNFLEENKEKSIVISFYNTEKKKVQKNINKIRNNEKQRVEKDARTEALNLIGQTVNLDEKKKEKKEKNQSFFNNLKEKLNFYKLLKEKIKRKKLLDEVNMLIEEDSKIKNEIAEKKLENLHKGLVKEISENQMLGYKLYGKILGANKISGDTFGLEDEKDKYKFFIGDATGHGIRAGFIIGLLSRLFRENLGKSLKEMVFKINNGLKQDLKSRNFVTGIFFEINKKTKGIGYIGVGHEKMLLFRKKTNKIEQIIPGGLAAGIRLIKQIDDLKTKQLKLEDGDILLTYSDGIIENKNLDGNFYGIKKLEEAFKEVAKGDSNIKNIYNYIINDVKLFKGNTNFNDDATIILLKRDTLNDVIDEDNDYIEELKTKEGLANSDIKKLKGKTKQEILKELVEIKKQKEIKIILKNLEQLYFTGEVLKLKEECIRFIKEGYIHKKINHYLKKAIENEKKYKVDQKRQKVEIKYNILNDLYKKGDFTTVINEIEDIIAKDGNI